MCRAELLPLSDVSVVQCCRQVSGQDVADMFDHFKILQTVPAYQAFLESGSDDPAEVRFLYVRGT